MDDRLRAHFDVVYGSLREYNQGLFDSSFKATGLILLVLGWLLTSKEARAYLAATPGARRLAAVCLAIGFAAFVAISLRAYQLSQTAFRTLGELNYLPVTAYADHRVQFGALVIIIAQNALLTLLVCYFVLGLGSSPSTTSARPAPGQS